MKIMLVIVALALLAGCASRYRAPVTERESRAPPAAEPAQAQASAPVQASGPVPDARPETYVVKRGDTLFSIALDHGFEYRELAEWNGITNPNVIQIGQVLRMRPPDSDVQVRPATGPGRIEGRPIGGEPASAQGVRTRPRR